MGDERGILALLDAVRRQWRVAVLIALPVLVGAVFYAETLPDEYTSEAVIAFTPRAERETGADVIRITLPKYTVFATSELTARLVARELDTSTGRLEAGLDAQIPSETATVEITFTDEDPAYAADAANAFADETVELASRDELVSAAIVAPAVAAEAPSGPPRRLLEVAAVLAAALIGIAVAVVVERARPRVQTSADVVRATALPVLGRLPRNRRGWPAEALADPAVGSAVRALRTSVDRESEKEPVQVLVVTSTLAGEGKTTLAGLLAAAIARLDVRVLIIDGDLSRPMVAKRLDVDSPHGLVDVLRGDVSVETAVQTLPNGLSVLTSHNDTDAGDLLAQHFPDVLATVRRDYDVVVIDAPPILGDDAGQTLATFADGVLLVVSGGTPMSSVSEATATLNRINARLLGTVANRVRDPEDYYGYGMVP